MSVSFFHKELILDPLEAESGEDAIRKLGGVLVSNGYVDPSYTRSVIERESNFPTGLPLPDAVIAIPHATPAGNVFKDSIAVARLLKPVKFHSMEDPEQEVSVNLIFLLALKDSHSHLDMLKKLFTVFQKPGFLQSLAKCSGKEQIMALLQEIFASDQEASKNAG